MPVVEPQVDREKLAEVLAEGSESEVVEFKRSCNLDERHDIVMLAAEVGAMQMPVDGGYIGLGFQDDGSVADGLSEAEARLLDPATIRDKLLPYLPEPLELLAAVHEIDGKRAGLIYVAPSSDGFSIFEKDGSYYDAKGQEQRRFRAGEVFARHGTASERWNQRDIARIRQRLVEQERERWAVELRRDLPNLGLAAEAQQLSEAPAAALVWQMDGETFVATVIEQLRRGDDVPLSLLLTSLPVEAATLLRRPGGEEQLAVLLDRLTCLAATFLVIRRADLFERIIETLFEIYLLGFNEHGIARGDLTLNAPALWLMIVVRVTALGGLAVRQRRWSVLPELVLRRGEGYEWIPARYWLDHGRVMAARGGLLEREKNGQTVNLPLLALVRREVDRLACLRPDRHGEDEEILNSLCQFDFVASLIAIDRHANVRAASYPNFARFYTRRTEPIVVQLIEGGDLRETIFPPSDQDLADVIRALDQQAGQESWRYAGWDGFEDRRVLAFLEEHPPTQPS